MYWNVGCLFFWALAIPLSSSTEGPYHQIYPPLNGTDDRTPLFISVVLAFGGERVSHGALPGVQIALDYINREPSILPGYSLHYTLTHSEVSEINGMAKKKTKKFCCLRVLLFFVLHSYQRVYFVSNEVDFGVRHL